MKKIISLVLAIMMSLNICIIANAGVLSGSYTFIDSAYSPKLDMYVAMAKDFTSGDHQTQLYRSTDAINWTPCFTSTKSGKNYANGMTRQNLVWWENEGVFATYIGNSAFISEDGIKWVAADNINVGSDGKAKSNGIIETNGDKLVVVRDRFLRIVPGVGSEETEIEIGNSGRYFRGVGIYPNEDKFFALDGSAWGGYTSSVSGSEVVVKEKFNNNQFAVPFDVVYVPQLNCWITINEKKATIAVVTSEIVTAGNTISYKTPNLEGEPNTENLTGIGVGEKYVVIGTESGGLYYTKAEDASNAAVNWHSVTASGDLEIPSSEIRTITKSRDGFMIALSKDSSFVLQETDEGVIFADTKKCIIKSSVERIEAPQTGTEDIKVAPLETNYFNQPEKGITASVEAAEGNEDVQASWDGSKIIFTVPETAEGKRAFTATDIYGNTHDFEVMFVKESNVDLEGYSSISLPDEGEEDVEIKYTPYVLASDGEKMNRTASISVVSAPNGVSFDADKNIVTLSSESEIGTLVLRVTSDGKPENTKDFEISVTKRMPTTIDVTTSKTELLIPENGSKSFNSTAVVKDQVQLEMPKEKVKWSLEGITDGITIDEDSGDVTVTEKAHSGNLNVVATSVTDNNVTGKAVVKLTWTDERCVKEELAAFDENTVTGKNLPFVTLSENGVEIEWTTSDESVITKEGIITRNRQKDTYATVTMSAKKSGISGTKTINVTVLKADNIASIGDFEDGKADGINGTIINESENVNSGEYALKTNGKLEFTVDVNKGSIYVFEAYVKASDKVTISTGVGGNLASVNSNGRYTRVAGTNLYTKQDLTETVSISASGDWYVDDIKVYEMTLEYEEIIAAVTKAETSRKKEDVEAARELVNKFPDTPLKDSLIKRLDAINTNSTNSTNKPSGGSSGGGGSSYIPPSSTSTGTVGITGTTINNDDKIYEYLLVFKDMSGHWAKDDVEYMANLGIVNGVDDTNFNPDASITRAEFAKLIVKTMGLSEPEYENTYYDIVSEDWYASFVQAAKDAGYMSGYNGLFRPNDKITREEIAKVIVSAYNQKTNKSLEQGGALYFNDIENISSWAYDYIVAATREGFINGISEELFAPKQNATRAQAVVMLKRLYDKING